MLTPSNITVIRFAHDGIEVKSMLVPLVEATAVPDLMMLLGETIVAVPSDASVIAADAAEACWMLVVFKVLTDQPS